MDKSTLVSRIDRLGRESKRMDSEYIHTEADRLLLAFLDTNGYKDIAQAWRDAEKRCGGYWWVC